MAEIEISLGELGEELDVEELLDSLTANAEENGPLMVDGRVVATGYQPYTLADIEPILKELDEEEYSHLMYRDGAIHKI